MKTLTSQVGPVATEFFVVDLTNEPVKINLGQQVDDVVVSTPDGDILCGWDYADDSQFTETNCMLIQSADHMKEINDEQCTHFYLMKRNKDDKTLRVYITAQRN